MTQITIAQIKQMLDAGKHDEALQACGSILAQPDLDTQLLADVHYMRGKVHMRCGRVRDALNDYLAAIDLDPDGPATQAYQAAQTILAFYDKNRYNP